MILLVLIALLILPSDAGYSNSFRVHLSEVMRLKCDELPFRTAYIGSRCYFSVTKEVKYSEAAAVCSSIFPGAQLASKVPDAMFTAMMLDKTKFHVGKDSSEAKQSICAYDSGYKCDAGEKSKTISGKCVASTDKQSTYAEAEKYCDNLGMEIPTIDNELDNFMIRGAINKPAWIRNIYDGQATTKGWKRGSYFSNHKTCPRTEMRSMCTWKTSSIIEKSGYWSVEAVTHRGEVGAVCIKDAQNEFTVQTRKPCVTLHEWDEDTGKCEWTGPKDACIQLIDYQNKTLFMSFATFPKETYREFDLYHARIMDNDAVKVIVRRGCMFTGYSHPLDSPVPGDPDVILVEHLQYGVHRVPSQRTGDNLVPGAGLTRNLCFCDPTEATINDHVPAPPPRKKCIEHHEFNEATQSCEWKHDPKYCAELITSDGRRQKLEIPNWPVNKKYDVNHWENLTKRAEDFHVTDIIVRQHCWATLYWMKIGQRMTLKTSGYGRHQVASLYNSMLRAEHDGTHRVVCECIS